MKTKSLRWAFKTFILSIFLSIVFGIVSQSLFPNISAYFSVFIILFFIFISVIFDMIGVSVASLKKEKLELLKDEIGYKTAVKMSNNIDKISSFCGDVVGDICGILSGAGGVSLVVNMHIQNQSVFFLVTSLISSFIAGLTIFFKAVMKTYAVENSLNVIMKVAKTLETNPFSHLFKKNKK